MKFQFQELRNSTKEDFSFTYDSAVYVVKAGSSELLPDFVAQLGAERLTDKMWRNPLDTIGRKKMLESFLGKVVNEVSKEVKPSLTEQIQNEKKEIEKVEKVEPVKEFADLELKKK